MLILSRKLGESVIIGENVKVTVVDIDRGKIRLGVAAPPGIVVDREEIHLRKLKDIVEDDIEADLKELQGDKKATF